MAYQVSHVSSIDPRVSAVLAASNLLPEAGTSFEGADAWLATVGGTAAAAAVVRLREDHWYLWLMAVVPSFRRQGIGMTLLDQIEAEARAAGVTSLRLRTYRHWEAMQRLLRRRNWVFLEAVESDRHDGVEEEWLLPILQRPVRAILVGGNPKGRGGELLRAAESMGGVLEVVGVCDSSADVRQHWAKHATAATVDELLATVDSADAAILAVPHAAYHDVRSTLLKRGLAIYHEKPLACSLAELMELQEQLEQRPVPLVVGVQRRSHPSYVYLKKQLERERPRAVTIEIRLGLSKDAVIGWRGDVKQAGGGALIDLGYHAVDLAHYLLDAPLVVVTASLWDRQQPAAEGSVETAATVVGRCGTTWVSIHVDRVGDRKFERVVADGEVTWTADREGVRRDQEMVYSCDASWTLAERGRLAELCVACAKLARRQSTPRVDLWDHLAQLQVIESARFMSRLSGFSKIGVGDDAPS